MIGFYKYTFGKLKPQHNSNVNHFEVAKYLTDSYNIPFNYCLEILKKYVHHFKVDEVGEDSFVKLMIKLNSCNISDIPGRISLFQIIDKRKKFCITEDDLNRAIEESDIEFVEKMKISRMMILQNFNRDTLLDFLDFLEFMDRVDKVIL